MIVDLRVFIFHPEENFLKQSFGDCRQFEQGQFAIADAPQEVPEFEVSNSDHDKSDESEADFSVSDADSFFAESDPDAAGPSSSKRRYAQRRSEALTFLGKPVCVRACARLLGVGQTTLQKIRVGEEVYVQKSERKKVPACAKHPAFGFAMRGHVTEQCLCSIINNLDFVNNLLKVLFWVSLQNGH